MRCVMSLAMWPPENSIRFSETYEKRPVGQKGKYMAYHWDTCACTLV